MLTASAFDVTSISTTRRGFLRLALAAGAAPAILRASQDNLPSGVTLDRALELSRRIFAAYRDDAVIQAYVPGRNARASFLAVAPDAGADALSIAFVEAGTDFQTMADSLALYGETGARAMAEGRYAEPLLVDVAAARPAAAARMEAVAAKLMRGLGLRDVFSMDLRVGDDDSVHLIEFEVCPGLPCFDFRAHCRSRWSMDLAQAIAATAAGRLPAP